MKSSRAFYIRSRPGRAGILLALAVLTALSAGASLCLGAVSLPLRDTLRALLGGGEGTLASQIVLYARLPRVCGSLLAGGALAASGVVIQSVLMNPLAAPNIIGVNSGAGLATALCCAAAPTALELVPIAAFLGALAGVLLVLLLAERTGAARITVVLAGLAVSSIFGAGIDGVVTLVPDALNGYTDFRIGGLRGLSMARVAPAAVMIALALAAVLTLSHELDLLALGRDTAQSLGLPARRLQLILLALAAALAGAAISFAGLLGFVGLIVPHIARRLVGEESRFLLPASALGGAALLTACDVLARLLFAPYELPVGIVLSFVGGPFFIWLLLRQRGGRTHD
jgi:iron complex transport system permease protein